MVCRLCRRPQTSNDKYLADAVCHILITSSAEPLCYKYQKLT